MLSFKNPIDRFLAARMRFAYGTQRDYFDHPDVVGWTRSGNERNPSGMAVLVNDHPTTLGSKRMCLGARKHSTGNRRFVDLMQSVSESVVLDTSGCGTFLVKPASVSVWVDLTK